MAELNLKSSEECVSSYQDLKMKGRYHFIVYKLVNNYKEIVVDSKLAIEEASGSQEAFEQFKRLLPADECRWAVFTVVFEVFDKEGRSNGMRSKTLFVSSTPNNANVKNRLLYASAKSAFKKKLDGIAIEVQSSPEITFETLLEKCKQFSNF